MIPRRILLLDEVFSGVSGAIPATISPWFPPLFIVACASLQITISTGWQGGGERIEGFARDVVISQHLFVETGMGTFTIETALSTRQNINFEGF